MFAFWRLVIFLISIVISSVILAILINGAAINITAGSSLPSLDLKSIPPADTIIPAIIEQGNAADFNFNPNTSTPTSTSTSTSTPTSTPTSKPTSKPTSTPTSTPTTLTPTTRKTTSRSMPKSTNTIPANLLPPDIMEKIPSLLSSENSSENSTENCLSFARNCRDIQCAFKNFKVSCNNTPGPMCACLTSGSTSIRGKINSFTLIISLIISLWVGLR